MVNAMRHADPLERLHHAILVLHRGHLVAIGEWQFDILIHGEIANEIEALKDETNFLIANARARGKIKMLHSRHCPQLEQCDQNARDGRGDGSSGLIAPQTKLKSKFPCNRHCSGRQ